VNILEYEVRLKTGFFETKFYALLISKGRLRLSPKIPEDAEIILLDKDISELLLKNGEDLEIEINTPGQSYQGTITYKADYEDLLRELKANLNMKILCEYEGGN
jgi:hypothetical protein